MLTWDFSFQIFSKPEELLKGSEKTEVEERSLRHLEMVRSGRETGNI